jgi:hypothetical protein
LPLRIINTLETGALYYLRSNGLILYLVWLKLFELYIQTSDIECGTDTHNYTGVERITRAFLERLQQNPGAPIYTLSPEKARAVISNLQAGPVSKLPVDIENY